MNTTLGAQKVIGAKKELPWLQTHVQRVHTNQLNVQNLVTNAYLLHRATTLTRAMLQMSMKTRNVLKASTVDLDHGHQHHMLMGLLMILMAFFTRTMEAFARKATTALQVLRCNSHVDLEKCARKINFQHLMRTVQLDTFAKKELTGMQTAMD